MMKNRAALCRRRLTLISANKSDLILVTRLLGIDRYRWLDKRAQSTRGRWFRVFLHYRDGLVAFFLCLKKKLFGVFIMYHGKN